MIGQIIDRNNVQMLNLPSLWIFFFEIEEKRKEKTKNETMLSSINKKKNIAGAEYKLIEGGKHRKINFSRRAIL